MRVCECAGVCGSMREWAHICVGVCAKIDRRMLAVCDWVIISLNLNLECLKFGSRKNIIMERDKNVARVLL